MTDVPAAADGPGPTAARPHDPGADAVDTDPASPGQPGADAVDDPESAGTD